MSEATNRAINPWTWGDRVAVSQAIETTGGQRILHCSGQTSLAADGAVLHAGDMDAQTRQALDNVEVVLTAAEMTLTDVVRLNYYTTDVNAFREAMHDVIVDRLRAAGCAPACTLLGVQQLARPELLIEIEATAIA